MVFPEDADLGVLVPEGPAVEKQREFRAEGDGDGDDGGEVEVHFCGVFGVRGEFLDGEGDEDKGDGRHEEAEDDVSGGFYARFAGGEAVRIDVGDCFVAEDEGDIGERIEDGVGHGGE